jgi:hypothetical protein
VFPRLVDAAIVVISAIRSEAPLPGDGSTLTPVPGQLFTYDYLYRPGTGYLVHGRISLPNDPILEPVNGTVVMTWIHEGSIDSNNEPGVPFALAFENDSLVAVWGAGEHHGGTFFDPCEGRFRIASEDRWMGDQTRPGRMEVVTGNGVFWAARTTLINPVGNGPMIVGDGVIQDIPIPGNILDLLIDFRR